MKRIKLKPKNPNPLFEFWLEEWRKEAASKKSDLQYHFSKALDSLRKYPLPLKSGKDCIILQHFGSKLCSMLDRKLKEHEAQNEDSSVNKPCIHCNCNEQHVFKRKYKSQSPVMDIDFANKGTGLVEFDNLNLSSWNLENYVVLLTLHKKMQNPCYAGYISEVDLLSEIKELCGHASKTSILDLFNNGLISMIGAPIRYNLTEYGISISEKICEVTDINIKLLNFPEILNKIQVALKSLTKQKSELMKDLNNVSLGNADNQPSNECSTDKHNKDTLKPSKLYKSKSADYIKVKSNKQQLDKNFIKQKSEGNNLLGKEVQNKIKNQKDCANEFEKNVYLESKTFEIVLLVDTQETSGGQRKRQYDVTIMELTQLGVLFEIRHLKVGDFAWIARCKSTNNELILPYIVERKRIDDLSASIIDGRFHEQKFRLKQSGIINLMYIIEEYEKSQRLPIPHSSLMQASINTLIQDGFSIKYTKSHKDSMFYLSSLTRILIKVFKEKNLIGCKKEDIPQTADTSSNTYSLMEFKEFNKAASKQKMFKVSEMFVRQLVQLKGMSVDKALAIVKHYPTPRMLIEAFQKSDCNGELLLANIAFGEKNRFIGPTISKTIYQLYTKKNLN